ncbi:Magnesium transporters: CorA family [Klebsormidium nitens]|uniref:Magnesium transporters: CorA family n=1 Tax=Klebsormidium nitens TaxID=105231 RepID=A0A1Y1ISG9_KLENI|nr:Magnesium transporters: CorA family [Klebsormidium nitens]|eukprot:GAQ91118.1 Magnesium transporters: CorA family [Klebsormidium nitens]
MHKPGSAKRGDAAVARQPSPSPLGRRLKAEERPSSSSRPGTPNRVRGRATSPARGGDAAAKPRGLGMRSWLRIDPTGATQIIEADKYAIMRRCAIPARDLRILDPVLVYPSTILGREKAIVINLEHIKAIVTAEEVLLQNYQNPHVQLFVAELQRRLASLRDHLALDYARSSPPPSMSPNPAGSPVIANANLSEHPTESLQADSLLLAPGLTARGPLPSSGRKAVAQAAVGRQDSPGARGKSPLGRGASKERPKSPPRAQAPPGREQRWHDLMRENSLRGRSWSPVRRSARDPLLKGSPERQANRERVRSLSPLPRASPPARSRGASPAPQRPRSAQRPTPPQKEASVWAPFTAIRDRMFGRKKSYQRLPSPDSDGRHASPVVSTSQVLFLDGGDGGGGGTFVGQGMTAPVVLPFEFRALEVILETVCGHLDVKSAELEREAYPALDDLTVKIISANLERVRRYKSRLVGLSVRVQKVRDELEGLLDDDGDMLEMYLTDKLMEALEPTSPQSSLTAGGGFGSVMAGSSPHLSPRNFGSHQPSTSAIPEDPTPPSSSAPALPPLNSLDPGPSERPPTEGSTPRLGPVHPDILDVGFSSEGPRLMRELTFNQRGELDEAIPGGQKGGAQEGGQERGAGPSVPEGAAGHDGGHTEADDQVSPLLRHLSSHSARSLRRGRSRSRSRSGSRSRASRSSVSRSSRSSKSTRKSGKGEDVEELEMLLEAYFAQIEGTLNKLSALREYIEDTEDYINIRLDDHQNQLLLLVILITIGTVAASIAVIVGGVFGMNVQCSFYSDPRYFPWVMWSTLAACVACVVGIVGWLHWKKLLSL